VWGGCRVPTRHLPPFCATSLMDTHFFHWSTKIFLLWKNELVCVWTKSGLRNDTWNLKLHRLIRWSGCTGFSPGRITNYRKNEVVYFSYYIWKITKNSTVKHKPVPILLQQNFQRSSCPYTGVGYTMCHWCTHLAQLSLEAHLNGFVEFLCSIRVFVPLFHVP
jgi:hypothetical protein